jgi:Major Facilitator Superfamily
MPFFHLFAKNRIIAPPGFNRWKVPPASIAIHLCIGSVYAWSNFNPALIKVRGVVAPAADDWSLGSVVWIFSVAIVCLGLSAAVAGNWLERVGPRAIGSIAAICWGGGFLIGGLGIWLHQLWLLYLGYGVIGGIGLGLGYVSPVSTLIKWFPDRRGMAAGMAIMGFGGGAIIAAPLNDFLIDHFYHAPLCLGSQDVVKPLLKEGRMYASTESGERPVIVISQDEAAPFSVRTEPGVYVVGTGSTGVAETFVVPGTCYFLVMIIAAFSYRIPADNWRPANWTPTNAPEAAVRMISRGTVDATEALRTPQFYLLWIVLCFNVTAGIGVLGVAKTMMTEIFGTTLPHIVTARFAGVFVLAIGVFNMIGRFFWASASDYLGRQRTYAIYFLIGIPLYLSLPLFAAQQSAVPSLIWLACFYIATMLIFTMYGGGFATIPAYIADLFGTKYVGGIHGRLLTAWSFAGVLGLWAITSLRESSLKHAVHDLAKCVDPAIFASKFGGSLDQLDILVANKTVTLSKLMLIAPAGTINPSATLYNTTMYLMAGLLVIACIANALILPVDSKHHLPE